MEEYSKGSVEVEDKQKVEAHEQDEEVNEEDSSSSNSSSDTEEKVVSDSVELSQDVEPSSVEKWGDSDVAELDARETEDAISPSLELNKETEQFSSGEVTRDSELLSDVASKETMLPCFNETNDSTVDGVDADQAASENNAGNTSGFPELESKDNVEDLLQAANVTILETRDADELVDKPDIHESLENQPIIPLHPRVVQPASWKSCCGLFEVLRRSDR